MRFSQIGARPEGRRTYPASRHGLARTLVRGSAIALAALALATPAWALAADPDWFAYDRRAEYQSVTSTVLIPMSSGGSLTCDLSQPGTSSGAVAPGRFATMVNGFTTYAALNQPGAIPGGANFWSQRGYNYLSCDIRGTGRSVATTGEQYRHWMSAAELQDNYDVIEWAAAQPWSDGRVATYSASYGGGSVQRVAGARPPHLVAAAPGFPVDGYSEEGNGGFYRGGAALTAVYYWPVVGCIALGVGCDGASVMQEVLAHPLYDDFWRQSDYTQTWENVEIPILSHGSTNDSAHIGGTFENYVGLRKAGKNAYLVAGPYGHGAPPVNVVLAWFDHWVKQLPSAPLPPTRVTVQEQGSGKQEWQALKDWPPPESAPIALRFTKGMTLAAAAGEPGTASYEVGDDQKVVFDSAPLDEDVVVAGRPTFHLRAALSASDTIFVTNLYDVAPDGAATRVFSGSPVLKASHRTSHARREELRPGEFNDYTVLTFDQLWRFAKGHKIRAEVRGVDDGLFEEAPPGTITLATGAGGSYVTLPVRRAGGAGEVSLTGARGPFKFSLALSESGVRTALHDGIRARARCSAPCRVRVALVLEPATRRRFGLRSAVVARGAVRRVLGRRTFKVRFSPAARRKLRQGRQLRVRIVAVGTELDGGRRVTLREPYTLREPKRRR